MSMRRLRTWRAAVLPLAFVASAATVHAQGHITSPKEFFGHNIGDDYWLPNYDQFLAYWLRGSSGRQFARQSVAVVQNLNQTVDSIYSRAGVRPADALPAFAPTDFTDRDRVNGHGTLPRAVARICAWTWACSRPPIGFNDHANNTGYRLLGRVVINALRS